MNQGKRCSSSRRPLVFVEIVFVVFFILPDILHGDRYDAEEQAEHRGAVRKEVEKKCRFDEVDNHQERHDDAEDHQEYGYYKQSFWMREYHLYNQHDTK